MTACKFTLTIYELFTDEKMILKSATAEQKQLLNALLAKSPAADSTLNIHSLIPFVGFKPIVYNSL
jgi:hypothetical protein